MTRVQLAGAALTVVLAASLSARNSAAAATAPADIGKIADAIKADVTQFWVDYNAYDVAKVVGHYASDHVSMFHGAPNVVGTAAIEADLKKDFSANPNLHVTLSDQTVDVAASGDLAVFRSTFVATVTDPMTKKPATERGNYLAGYKPQADGVWKQEWSIISDVSQPPAVAPVTKG